MRDKQNAVLDALQRPQCFRDENTAVLTGVDFTAARKRLAEVLTSFATHALNQDIDERGANGKTAKQRQLRLRLRVEQMELIAVIAWQICEVFQNSSHFRCRSSRCAVKLST